jgi:uncharacterized protein (DUF111 family)
LSSIGAENLGGGREILMLKIYTSQHHASARLDEAGGELLLSALLDHGSQPDELIHSSLSFDARISFEIVERRGADGTRYNLALIQHGELNDHSIEVVAQNFTSLQRHCKPSVL